MPRLDLNELARIGAAARVEELKSELTAIYRAFPALRTRVSRAGAGETPRASSARRRRKPMSAAQKRVVGARMKKYWERWRKEHGKA